MAIEKVVKRDGSVALFDRSKIEKAIKKAMEAANFPSEKIDSESKRITDIVVAELERKYTTPNVEQIQDEVEKALVSTGNYPVAKAYVLYRALHEQIRAFVDGYLNQQTWLVKENANMTYSLQGLNNHISSEVIAQYWLHRIYLKKNPKIAHAHIDGDFHIHNLQILGPYCVGWDLRDLLLSGFTGVPGKITSKPAKHFRVALMQIVNFIYTLTGEAAGAQALSNVDTYLAPFIRYDKLDYKEVKQALQEFLFNMNVPTRVGFQCLSEDTKILTPFGWKSYNELKEGDIIYTFNLKTQQLEKKQITSIFVRKYKGIMYNLRNRNQDQLISPRHRVVRKAFDSDEYKLEPIEEVLKLKSQILIPTVAQNSNPDFEVSDQQLQLMAGILSEGSIEKEGSHRVSIHQSANAHTQNYEQTVTLVEDYNFDFNVDSQTGGGNYQHLRLLSPSSRIVHEWFEGEEKRFPQFLFNLSKRQARIFLEAYAKGYGWKEKDRIRIATTNEEFLEALQALAVLAGFNFTTQIRKPKGKKLQFILTLTQTKHDSIQSIRKVYYDGIIWSVHTDNETVIAKRNGQVFITGNTPFSNITLDLKVPEFMKYEPVIIGGKPMEEAYSDFQEEMNIFNKALFEVMEEGDGLGRPFSFPIPTINVTKDFDWDNEAIRKVLDATAKYGLPYFANFVNSDMKPEDVRSMCCHLRLDYRELKKRGGGLFGANPLTGSVGVTTINMPRIGYLSKDDSQFFERLDEMMELAKEALETKRQFIEEYTEKGLYPYSKFYLRNIKQTFGQYWKNHFSTIGLIGMNEACLNFLGEDIGSEEGRKFSLKVLDYMRDRLGDFQQETGNIFNLEATPAEGTSYRLALKDKKKFKDIIVANEKEYQEGAEPYYTNSSQLPVNYTDDIFELLKHQDDFQTKYTGGTVVHIFLGESLPSGEAVGGLVKKIVNNFKLPYFTITPTFSICPTHGYVKGTHEYCPICEEKGVKTKCEVYSRVVGYLRPVVQWNPGKQQEFKDRKVFDKSLTYDYE